MRSKKITPEQELNHLISELRKSFGQWNYINEHGCSDPNWSDGVNMNLVHNHIIYYKRQIGAVCEAHGLTLPADYHRETPPEVSNDYMARAQEIREKAKISLATLQSEPAYARLRAFVPSLKGEKAQAAGNALRRLHGLQEAIEKGDLVTMRRFGDVSRELSYARKLADSISDNDLNPQLSLFSFVDDEAFQTMQSQTPARKKQRQHER